MYQKQDSSSYYFNCTLQMVQEWKWANEQHLEQPKHDWIILVSVYLGQRDNQNIFGVVVQTKDQQKFILLYSLCTAFYTLANETTMMIFVYFQRYELQFFPPDNQTTKTHTKVLDGDWLLWMLNMFLILIGQPDNQDPYPPKSTIVFISLGQQDYQIFFL